MVQFELLEKGFSRILAFLFSLETKFTIFFSEAFYLADFFGTVQKFIQKVKHFFVVIGFQNVQTFPKVQVP